MNRSTVYPLTSPREEGTLKVSPVHTLFYSLYGNPKGTPVVVLHGGPGAGCNDGMSRFFNLEKWNVLMFDQRGTVRSTPLGCLEDNTASHSISDIEQLREHLGVKKWVVFGGSWGSTLALLYGQEHPTACLGFILRGVFLARKEDLLHSTFYGRLKAFPEAYDQFIAPIPEEERADIFQAYYKRIMDPDPQIHLPAMQAMMQFSQASSTFHPVAKTEPDPRLVFSMSRNFFHYAYNNFFLQPNQILSHMDRIAHLPCIIVNGRYDVITPPEGAYALHKQWPGSTLWIVTEASHSANDPLISAALASATDAFADRFRDKD